MESLRKTITVPVYTGLTGTGVQNNKLFSAYLEGLVTLGTITSSLCDHFANEKLRSQTSRITFLRFCENTPISVESRLSFLKIKAPCLLLITHIYHSPSFSLITTSIHICIFIFLSYPFRHCGDHLSWHWVTSASGSWQQAFITFPGWKLVGRTPNAVHVSEHEMLLKNCNPRQM